MSHKEQEKEQEEQSPPNFTLQVYNLGRVTVLVSRSCPEGVFKVSCRCLECIWKVSGMYLEGVWNVSGRCPEGVRSPADPYQPYQPKLT